MRPNPNRGRLYRRCGCRDEAGRQLGARCPQLTNPRHGSWAFAVDMPSPDQKRKTMRRSATPPDPTLAQHWPECSNANAPASSSTTPKPSPTTWSAGWTPKHAGSSPPPSPATATTSTTTYYRPSARSDWNASPTNTSTQFVRTQLAAGRGPVTVRRCIATLSSALNDAIRQRRLTHNAARYTAVPLPHRVERPCWTVEEAAALLHHCHRVDGPLTELFELLICTGMRKGEALGLHWADVDLHARLLFARHTLVAVDNSHLVLNTPQTTGSRDWIALSTRAVNALRRRARRHRKHAITGPAYHPQRLVFCRPDGQPLRPERVLRHFYALTEAADLPRIRVHDLRHLAATIMITAGVPLAMVSKTLRHPDPPQPDPDHGHPAAAATRPEHR